MIRVALKLLEEMGESVPALHLEWALALLAHDPRTGCRDGHSVSSELHADAFGHAIAAMAAIVESAAQRKGTQCVDAIARAMEDHGRNIASRDMGAALLLDHWAGIVRERVSLAEPVGRRDN